jgi:hypothetical protein
MGPELGPELEFKSVFEDGNHVRTILVNPGTVVLADHVSVRMPHRLRDPIDNPSNRAGFLPSLCLNIVSTRIHCGMTYIIQQTKTFAQ